MDQFATFFLTSVWTIVNIAFFGFIVFVLVMLALYINRVTRSRS